MEGMETTADSVTSLLMSKESSRSKGEYCCNLLENSLFSPVFFTLKMTKELKPVAFNVEPYQFELIATESDCKISDDIRPTAMASKVNDGIDKV